MSTNNSSKRYKIAFYALLTVLGCVVACTRIIPDDFIKFMIVIIALLVGVYGLIKYVGKPQDKDSDTDTDTEPDKKDTK